MDEKMVTKVNSRCYRFSNVDFEPESRSLFWQDSTVSTLTYEECRLLEMLCYHAGEVLSARILYASTSLPDSSFSQHQNSLCSLLAKSYRHGEKILPLEVVGDHGYRVALPQKTYQRQAEVIPNPSEPDPLDIHIDEPVQELKTQRNVVPIITGTLLSVLSAAAAIIYLM
ncbi:hypothetical protein A1OQ_01840 [Enterovibrio norvegicus FF-162]|uniref:OmpR/PhoB-type domain-containing protein n=1 Tax=Enterovibrio norvegicus FF-454 TaxID=1185651 RepID=A0A1E5BXY1_9GAMM|nr:hypothetical protein A1OK_16195 [Enterovibrio norvegicus FF-454]OEE89563.1 hypothetical protein A1OQ_01840 [Enterovibrio norvegicus FF-162]